jgi:hypothetical protein
VDDTKPKRRFQFSLRRLMLWMVVLGAYLGLMRLVELSSHTTFILTIWLAGLFAIRIKWGYGRGFPIALLGTMVLYYPSALLLVEPVGHRVELWEVGSSLVGGLLFGFCGFLVASWTLNVLNWTDDLMRTRTTEDDIRG